MTKTYIFLFGAIICEVAGTMLLPVTQNFTKITPSVILAICYMIFSVFCFSLFVFVLEIQFLIFNAWFACARLPAGRFHLEKEALD